MTVTHGADTVLQAPVVPIADALSVSSSGDIRHDGVSYTNYTVLELHRFLQGLADDASASVRVVRAGRRAPQSSASLAVVNRPTRQRNCRTGRRRAAFRRRAIAPAPRRRDHPSSRRWKPQEPEQCLCRSAKMSLAVVQYGRGGDVAA